jgi:hypothetical protein
LQRAHAGRERTAGLPRPRTRRQRTHPRRQGTHTGRQGTALAGLPRPLPLTGLARRRRACLPRLRRTALGRLGLAGAALGRRLGGGRRTGRTLPRAAVTALGGRPQARRDVRRHRRGMALHLHAHGGQPGQEVLGRDPQLFGEFVDARVAQPVLTSSCSLDRGRSRPEPSSVVSPAE